MLKRDNEIVLVDDDDFVRERIERTLRGMTWSVTFFSNIEKAINYLISNPVPVLIIDLRMPKMNADEVLGILAKEGVLEDKRIIVASSSEAPASTLKLLEPFPIKFVLKDVFAVKELLLNLID